MDNASKSPATDAIVDRAVKFAEAGNRFGVIAALGHAMDLCPDDKVRSMLLSALDPLKDPETRRSFLRQCTSADPQILDKYEARQATTVKRLARRASLPDRAEQTEAFTQCVVFKGLANSVDGPLVTNAMAIVADFFGRLAAQEAFGGPLPETGRADEVYTTHLAARSVKLWNSGGDDHLQHLLYFLLEPGLVRWIAGFRSDDVFLDVGANIGKYSVLAGAMAGVQTYALEPFSTNYDTLVANVALNGLESVVTPMRIALSDRTGSARLRYEAHVPGMASQNLVGDEEDGLTVETVEAARLDDLIASGTVAMPTRIKIDVDGEEWRLIAGMPRTLADPRLHSIRMEVRASPENQDAVRRIETAGFVGASDDDEKNLLFLRL